MVRRGISQTAIAYNNIRLLIEISEKLDREILGRQKREGASELYNGLKDEIRKAINFEAEYLRDSKLLDRLQP